MKTVAIDFDGVIHKYSKGWQDGSLYDDPIEGAKDGLKKMVDAGFRVIIFTTRLSKEANGDMVDELAINMGKWLKIHGFELGIHNFTQLTAVIW